MTWYLDTKYPIALDSYDSIFMEGAARDNHKNLEFNRRLYSLLEHPISVLDLGCSGGGFVETLVNDNHIAIGLEGSDYSRIHKRAAWKTIPNNLFTCDITKPFVVHQGNHIPFRFDVVTSWDVLEHIETYSLPQVFENVVLHIKPGGLFINTISSISVIVEGNEIHRTRQSCIWWKDTIEGYSFYESEETEKVFRKNWLRNGSSCSMAFMKE